MTRVTRRSGFNIVAVVLLASILAVSSLAFMFLAQESGRSSHWFTLSQVAFNVADTGMRESIAHLQDHNDLDRAKRSIHQAEALELLLRGMMKPGQSSEPILLMDSADPVTVTTGVRAMLDGLVDFSAQVKVSAILLGKDQLGKGVANIQRDPEGREQRGKLQLIATGRVKHATGKAVERSIIVEKEYLIQSRTLPLLGRFALFLSRSPEEDPNIVETRVIERTGEAAPPSGTQPIVLRQPVSFDFFQEKPARTGPEMVRDQAPVMSSTLDSRFLDRQGWVFLGRDPPPAGTSTQPVWKLNLAHGYRELGESHLLDGYRFQVLYGDDPGQDAAFRQRFIDSWAQAYSCTTLFPPDVGGLYHHHHGFATNFELLSLLNHSGRTQDDNRQRVKMTSAAFGNGRTSAFRLFGEPAKVAPTIVFGPAMARFVQRAAVWNLQDADCSEEGKQSDGLLQIFELPQDHEDDFSDEVLVPAFAERVDSDGTSVQKIYYMDCISTVLDPRIVGKYDESEDLGVLAGAPDPGRAPGSFVSDVLGPGLGPLSGPQGVQGSTLQALWDAKIDAADLYKGDLGTGLHDFCQLLKHKLTYYLDGAKGSPTMPSVCLSGRSLRVPGVVMVSGDFSLPEIDRVVEGGILGSTGRLTLEGSILGAAPAGQAGMEPLTLLALGDIVIGKDVRVIEAYLVSLKGKIKFQNEGDLVIRGGIAAPAIDLDSLRQNPGAREIQYVGDHDPLRLGRPGSERLMRVHYGDAQPVFPRVTVGGSDG